MNETKMDLCPNCFTQSQAGAKRCPQCDYNYESVSSAAHALKPMTIVSGRYLIGKVLGAGGFGVTYKAMDLLRKEVCAIKEYFPTAWAFRQNDGCSLAAKSENDRYCFYHGKTRFTEEARLLVRFENEANIVHVKNFFTENNTAYFVMEMLDGCTVRKLMNQRGGKLPFSACVQIFIAVADALRIVHEQDIMHRDISPENIFVTKDSRVILIDFGSARTYTNENEQLSVYIKPGVAPIEQYYKNGHQGPWTDIYALASTFYQAVSGVAVPAATDRVVEDKLRPVNEVFPAIPAGWNDIINKALSLHPENRYQSIDEMMDDINKINTVAPVRTDKPVTETPKTHTPKPAPPKPESPGSAHYAAVRPVIIVEQCKYSDDWRGRKYHLEKDKEYTLGRSVQKSDIVIDMAEYVSRSHCKISYDSANRCFLVKDISANYTFKEGGIPVSRESYERIAPGSRLYIGARTTVIRVAIENV